MNPLKPLRIKDRIKSPEKTSSFSARLQEMLYIRDMKQIDLANITNIRRGTISNYVSGRYEPKDETVQLIAEALNCSEVWLQGYDVPMGRPLPNPDDDENPYEIALLNAFDTLDIDDMKHVSEIVVEHAKDPYKKKISLSEPALTEGEKVLLELFRKVPEDKQQLVLQMIKAALDTPK